MIKLSHLRGNLPIRRAICRTDGPDAPIDGFLNIVTVETKLYGVAVIIGTHLFFAHRNWAFDHRGMRMIKKTAGGRHVWKKNWLGRKIRKPI